MPRGFKSIVPRSLLTTTSTHQSTDLPSFEFSFLVSNSPTTLHYLAAFRFGGQRLSVTYYNYKYQEERHLMVAASFLPKHSMCTKKEVYSVDYWSSCQQDSASFCNAYPLWMAWPLNATRLLPSPAAAAGAASTTNHRGRKSQHSQQRIILKGWLLIAPMRLVCSSCEWGE